MYAFFDLEGPLSPQDNAYEVMALVEKGREIFEKISRYDDLLTLEKRENYEPGDTLKLILPFLVYHGITQEDIARVSARAGLVKGSKELISELKERGWHVYIISTSYQQHAHNIAKNLGVSLYNVACTYLNLSELPEKGVELVAEVERRLEDVKDDKELKAILDDFYYKKLPETELGRAINRVEVVGGERKVRALRRFLERDGGDVKESIALGDSITDFKMLRYVRENGGLAIAFNANEYCLPHADVAVASERLDVVLPLFDAFSRGGRAAALELASRDGRFALVQNNVEELLKVHLHFRRLVRGEAGKLG